MAVVALVQGPSITREMYNEVVRRMTGGKSRLESLADWPPKGLIVHTAGEGPNGFRIVDVWESEEAFRSFGERLRPFLEAVGVVDQPEIYPADTVLTAAVATPQASRS